MEKMLAEQAAKDLAESVSTRLKTSGFVFPLQYPSKVEGYWSGKTKPEVEHAKKVYGNLFQVLQK